METGILARHGESELSARGLLNGDVAAACPLTPRGEAEARRLGEALAGDPVDLCVTSRFERTRQTADLALAGREVPRLVLPELDDPSYGEFEGRSLDEYRAWAQGRGSGEEPPGGGESRIALATRYARGFRRVLERPEAAILVVGHSLPIGYVLGEPRPRMPQLEHALPYRLSAAELRQAVERLEAWGAAPSW